LFDFSKLLADSRVEILTQALKTSGDCYLVGGCIRDFILGKEVKDLDIACPLSVEKMLALFEAKGFRCIETGAGHGTITVVVENSNVELTSFRGDSPEQKLPQQALIDDLNLRDFTINSMALNINSGLFVDPLDGFKDQKSKVLKACGNATDRFHEDPLRIMRMLRFGPANNFSIEQNTYFAAKEQIELLRKVSIERIQSEFSKILISSNPRTALNMLLELGILSLFIPEALASVGFEQNDFHTEDVFNHTLSVLEKTPPDLKMRLAAFFHDLGKPHTLSTDEAGNRHFYDHERKGAEICAEVMPRLKYSNDLTKAVTTIVRHHMRPIECGPAGVRRLMRDLASEFDSWRKFKEADHTPSIAIETTLEELKLFDAKVEAEHLRQTLEKQKKLAINGHDLMLLGLQSGPGLGRVIKILEEEVIEDPSLNTKEYLTSRAKEIISS
jgi:tRNA nucleotidyltransferase (CCA-adding enzyme)